MKKLIEQIKEFNGKQNVAFNRVGIETIIAMKTGYNVKIKDNAYNEIDFDGDILSIWTIEEELEIF